MKNKKVFKKIIVMLMLTLIFNMVSVNMVNAAITSEEGATTTTDTLGENILEFIIDALGGLGNIALTGVGAFITPLINVLSGLLLLTLQTVFSLSGGGADSPFPDAVVFNKVALLDANFINPHSGSIIVKMGADIFVDLFSSFVVIAETLFIIAAMITGLKLALTTIATKKALYKEAIMKWVVGFVILFCLKWLLAGVFYLNEMLVSALATLSEDITFNVKVLNFVPIIGAAINLVTEAVLNTSVGVPISGFGGMIAMLYAEAGGGNIIASIVAFIILGQSFVILGSYFKRLFMCILLGVVSPLVVAVDTITGIVGQKSTLFITWLKNFIFTVFAQSFHAAYMVVAMKIISNMWKDTSFKANYMATIVTIFLLTGLVKLEKTLKGILGMGESMAGPLSDGSKGIRKAMQSIAGLAAAGKAIGDNGKKLKEASTRRKAYAAETARLKGNDAIDKAKLAKANGNMDEYRAQMKLAAEERRKYLEAGGSKDNWNSTGSGSSGSSGGSENKGGENKDYLQSVLDQSKQPKTTEEKIQKLTEAEGKARADEKSAMLATAMSIPNLAAGIGMGIGMGDDVGETLFKGGMITAALDKGAEAVGYRLADKDRSSLDERERRDGKKYGYTPSENIQREKTTVDAALTFDIRQLSNQLTKQFRDLGYVFTDQVKKGLKEIDKDLDNE